MFVFFRPELVPVEKEKIVKFKFPECDHLSGSILQLDEVDFYYAKDKYIFRGVNISATMDSRICVVGENGIFTNRCTSSFTYSVILFRKW